MLRAPSAGSAKRPGTILVCPCNGDAARCLIPHGADPLHSYLALAALAMNQADIGLRKNTPGGSTTPIELKALDSCWNVSVETQQWLLSALRAL